MGLAIVLSFAALLLLVLLALVWSAWPAWMKGVLVLAVTGLYFFGNDAVHQIWGVPSTDALPERFVVLAGAVDEPAGKSPGSIFLWVSEPREGLTKLEPRAYRVPYSKELHTQIEAGVRKGKDGISQMGLAEAKAGNARGLGWLKPGNDEQEIKLRDMPSPQLPEK
ncbi:MAG: hypothetical protein V4750_03895 [Pseudomonadota bacterium]